MTVVYIDLLFLLNLVANYLLLLREEGWRGPFCAEAGWLSGRQ